MLRWKIGEMRSAHREVRDGHMLVAMGGVCHMYDLGVSWE